MSTKYVVAAAAVALVATSEARPMHRIHHKLTTIDAATPALYEDADWEFNAGLSGQVGQKPNYQVGISGKWDEEQGIGSKLDKALNTVDRAVAVAGALGVLDEEEQGVGSKLNKALNTVDHAINTAQAVGLLEEEQSLKKLTKAVKKVAKVAVVASEMGLLEEEEEQGIGSKLDNILNKVDKAVDTANKVKGVVDAIKTLDEEEEQKFKLGKALKKAAKVAVKANELGLLEDADWEFNAGLSGQVGQKPNYQVGISGKWEEEEQKLKLGKVLKKAVKVATTAQAVGLLDEEEEQKFKLGKTLKKAVKVATTAQQLGLLDEEQGLYGSKDIYINRPVFNPTLFDEEQGFGTKLNNALNTIDHAVNTAKAVGILEEDEEAKFKIGKALKKVAKVAVVASEMGLLEEEEEQGLGKKLNKILDKVDKATATAHRIQDTVNAIKGFDEEEEQKFKLGKALKKAAKVAVKANELGLLEEESFLGGEGSTWINRPYAGSAVWEEEEQKFKLGKALKKAAKVAVKANELGLLEEESFLGGENGKRWPQRPTPPYFLDTERF